MIKLKGQPKITMRGIPYSPADLTPLCYCISRKPFYIQHDIRIATRQIHDAGNTFVFLGAATDIPSRLRRYYKKIGKRLFASATAIDQFMQSTQAEGDELDQHIRSILPRVELTDEVMIRLGHVNNRLRELEHSLKQKIDGLHERLKGLNPAGVAWDDWDMTEIVFSLRIEDDTNRPSYNTDTLDEADISDLEIHVSIYELWKYIPRDDPWGLDDGKNHGDSGDIPQCYLFNEFYEQAGIGAWGMLHLHSLFIEIIPHRSGSFSI